MPSILMPALSPTMEEGKLAKWLKNVGDMVKPGDVIAEIETDKATMEFESFDKGHVLALVAEEGEPLPIGAVIAYLLVQEISALLPVSFGFAAGAMLALTLVEILPESWRSDRRQCSLGLMVSIPAMVLLSLALGV